MPDAQYHDRHRLDFSTWPEFVELYTKLRNLILGAGEVQPEIKLEIFTVASLASGCRHCQAHGSYGLHLHGTKTARIQGLWDFEHSDLFSESDRAVLRLARDAAFSPNAVTPEHFEELSRHFNDRKIVEMLAVVGLSGFLNRYMDTTAVVTDQESVEWARKYLKPLGWDIGKHQGAMEEQRAAFPHDSIQSVT